MLKLNLEKKSYGLLVFILTTNSIFFFRLPESVFQTIFSWTATKLTALVMLL